MLFFKLGFAVWKTKIEKDNSCVYVSQSTKILQKKPYKKRYYFKCHRSGAFVSQSTGVRKIKKEGSHKIDSTCTSTMVSLLKTISSCNNVHRFQIKTN